MEHSDVELDITRKLRTIEWLKAELIEATSSTFKALMQDEEEQIVDALAGLLLSTYLLARRLGIDYRDLEHQLEKKLKLSIENEHEIEKWYGDLSALLEYLEVQKR